MQKNLIAYLEEHPEADSCDVYFGLGICRTRCVQDSDLRILMDVLLSRQVLSATQPTQHNIMD